MNPSLTPMQSEPSAGPMQQPIAGAAELIQIPPSGQEKPPAGSSKKPSSGGRRPTKKSITRPDGGDVDSLERLTTSGRKIMPVIDSEFLSEVVQKMRQIESSQNLKMEKMEERQNLILKQLGELSAKQVMLASGLKKFTEGLRGKMSGLQQEFAPLATRQTELAVALDELAKKLIAAEPEPPTTPPEPTPPLAPAVQSGPQAPRINMERVRALGGPPRR